jgi:cellobiose phosphorylase
VDQDVAGGEDPCVSRSGGRGDGRGAALPRARLLSNGSYTALLSGNGCGFARLGELALTAWSADPLADPAGHFVFVRDCGDGAVWSLGAEPAGGAPESYALLDAPGSFGIARIDRGIAARMEACIAPDLDVELRWIRLENRSDRLRVLEVTGDLEVVLAPPAAHSAHPAFAKLFVQTERLEDPAGLLARRRPRAAGEAAPCLVQALVGPGPLEVETDRARFLGRGHTRALPRALRSRDPLSGTTGSVLDPVFAARRRLSLAPRANAELCFVTGAAEVRAEAVALLRRALARPVAEHFAGAAERERGLRARLGITEVDADRLHALAAAVLCGRAPLGVSSEALARAAAPLAVLGACGLSADRPYAVVDADDPDRLAAALRARSYWAASGLSLPLLALAERSETLAGLERAEGPTLARLRRDVPATHLETIVAAAGLVVEGSPSLLSACFEEEPIVLRARAPEPPPAVDPPEATRPSNGALRFENGVGGFSADGREYVIRCGVGPEGLRLPPLPWTNVIANEGFGCIVSETGAGCTWSRNSREHRLTPWSNDPVLDPPGEALYLRDEDSGALWSPTPGPRPAPGSYETRHGLGYTCFHRAGEELEQETTVFVARHDPVKVVRVTLTHRGGARRRLALYAYQQLVLGSPPAPDARFIVSSLDSRGRLLRAENRLGGDFADGVAFAAAVTDPLDAGWSASADRAAFLGGGGVSAPELPGRGGPLDGRTGAGLAPCFAQRVELALAPGERRSVSFLLGETRSPDEAQALVARLRRPGAVDAALAEVRGFWADTVAGVQVETPSPGLDLMVNGWLPYQTLACRLWGRSAFYQSGGAFGYRDQLQDAAALVWLSPGLTRAQILLHAAHQFVEGDVLHWWHPAPMERGLRTRFSDDLAWLPFVVASYVAATGDTDVLAEPAPFLRARLLAPGEDEALLAPTRSGETADVYTHCCRALDRSLTRGAHGLPLMGTGDWNDGMNRVGREGRGESVWMGFFLHAVLGAFLPLCAGRNDRTRVERYGAYRRALEEALEDAGWDGSWYRRAYYDDGTPLGTRDADECRIDALAQAWAVLSGVAPRARAEQAMDAVEAQLVSEPDGLIRLLTPPFADTPEDPGYIKGYVKGVRENGGQYTHAACWVVAALAVLGRRERAARLLEMLSPISHTSRAEAVARYRLEPYVVAADVYGEPPHTGRGGWSWYTGSAGWLYRVALESVLGLGLEAGRVLSVRPCLPAAWPGFRATYRLPDGATRIALDVRSPSGGARVVAARLDGRSLPVGDGVARIPLPGDGAEHRAEVVLG